MKDHTYQVLETLRLPNGLYLASLSDAYQYVWVRDTCYIAMAHLHAEDKKFEETFHALLDIFKKYQWKIQYHGRKRPREVFEYIHPRYHRDTFEELVEPWGNAQNDAIGVFLFGIGQGMALGKGMLRDETDRQLIQDLIQYLTTLQYWKDEDNGIWEENREIHASSIGACLAGSKAVAPYFVVPDDSIKYGEEALFTLLPRESVSKDCDLALLSLVYPYNLLTPELSIQIITDVESKLMRTRGVIRYLDDQYYQEDGKEAEWCFGFPWLGLCWAMQGDRDRAKAYLKKTEDIMFAPGVLPEMYLGSSGRPNANTPLAWANSMYIQLFDVLYHHR